MSYSRVHVPVKDGSGGVSHMQVNPYIWLGSADGTIILKDGGVFSAGWDPIPVESLSDAQWKQIEGLSVKARESVNFSAKRPSAAVLTKKESGSGKS